MIQRHRKDSPASSRREFIRNAVFVGAGLTGMGAFLQSCAEKEIKLTGDLAKNYLEKTIAIIETVYEREMPNISRAATISVQAKLQGHALYSRITGNMFPQETMTGRPGSPDIFLTEGIEASRRDDVVVTNDANVARGLGEQYVKVIGFTTPFIPNFDTPPGALENMGVMRIEDVSDIIIHCHVPHTDGILNVQGIDVPVCPASGVIHSLMYYALSAEIVEGFTKSGIYPRIG